jgi:hypothetical protein
MNGRAKGILCPHVLSQYFLVRQATSLQKRHTLHRIRSDLKEARLLEPDVYEADMWGMPCKSSDLNPHASAG